MLHAHFMIRTHNRPLEKAPDAFNAVGVNVAMHPFLFGMVDRAVHRVLVLNTAIARMLVGVNLLRVRSRRLVDEIVKLLFVHPLESFKTNRAFALKRADNACLVTAITTASVTALSAYISFVHFDRALKRQRIYFLHRGADAMAEEPSRAIGAKSKRALHLASGDALFALSHQVDRKEPFPDREMAVVKDRARRDGKLILTVIAAILFAVFDGRNLIAFAARALDAFRPAKFGQVFAGLVFVGELLHQLDEVHVIRF